jgi:ribosomal protein S27AE
MMFSWICRPVRQQGLADACRVRRRWMSEVPDYEAAGDPACWLPRVCPDCGAMADTDRPFTCAVCHAEVPAD